MRDSEVSYATKAILANPENESPWRYLRGLHKGDNESWVRNPQVSSACLSVLRSQRNCIFALGTLLELLCHGFQPTQEVINAVEALRTPDSDTSDAQLAVTVCSILENIDPLRAHYWRWRKGNLPFTP